jgi:hypothetical protein
VLKTVFVFESYLKGSRSSFAILNNCPRHGQGEGTEVGFTQNTKSWPKCLGLNHNCPVRHFKSACRSDPATYDIQPLVRSQTYAQAVSTYNVYDTMGNNILKAIPC